MSGEVNQADHFNISTNSVNSINNDTNMIKIVELFHKIRKLLSMTVDDITSDSSLIDRLNQLIIEVGLMQPYFNRAQLGYYLALHFFMMLYNNNTSLVDEALGQLHRCQEEFYVFKDSMSQTEADIKTDPTIVDLKRKLEKASDRYGVIRKKREETADAWTTLQCLKPFIHLVE
jgi:hypothetical protein